MTVRVEHQPAYVLHRRPYRETSCLVDVLTPDHGKVALVAKGARRPRSQEAALIQPFQSVQVSWMGRSDLKTLTSIEPRHQTLGMPAPVLVAEWLFAGFYINELLEILLVQQDPAPELFAVYETTLAGLRAREPLEPGLRWFEKHLLELLGVGLDFSHDAESGALVEADQAYLLMPDAGFVRLAAEASAPAALPGHSRSPLVVPGRILLALADDELTDAASLRFAKQIMRHCIDAQLQGRRLRSRELFRQYKESHRV